MILSGPEIVRIARDSADWMSYRDDRPLPVPFIHITPFDPSRAGPNSYDVTLASELRTYTDRHLPIDSRCPPPTTGHRITDSGFVLEPGELYLGSTVEHTECHGVVPWLDGRSSIGRLGIQVHVTAGRGDDGFRGNWTLEITVVRPVRVYPNLRIGQLSFFLLSGERKPYNGRYQGQRGAVASRINL